MVELLKEKLSSLRARPYETQVLLLIAALATFRVFIALVFDFLRSQINAIEVLTDFGLLLVFGGMLAVGLAKADFKEVSPWAGVLIIILLALNFVEFAGVEGTARFNYYCGFFVVILLYSGRTLQILLGFQIALLIFLSVATYQKWTWAQPLFISTKPDPTDFLFAVISLGILAFYLKSITVNELKEYDESNEKLNEQVRKAKKMNETLVAQGKELKLAQTHLEEEIKRRTSSLQIRQGAIEKYIHMNTEVLQQPIDNLNKAMSEFQTSDTIGAMMRISKNELNEVFRSIKQTLEAQEELNRTKIKPS